LKIKSLKAIGKNQAFYRASLKIFLKRVLKKNKILTFGTFGFFLKKTDDLKQRVSLRPTSLHVLKRLLTTN